MNARPLRRVIAAVSLVAVFLSATAFAENWPGWRGPRGNSTSAEKNIPIVWNEKQSVLWKCELPEWGTSTPAIWNNAIFVTSHVDNEKLVVLRIDNKTGKVVWTRQVGTGEAPREAPKREKQKFHRLHNLASPSPVTDGKTVVVHFGNGDLVALDTDGKQLWKRNLQDDYGTYTIWWGHANSPVIYQDTVISVCMQDSLADMREKPVESYLVAHDLQTGKVRWKTLRMTDAKAEECDAYTTPIFCPTDDGLQMVIMGGNQLDAYDPATGKQLWHLPGLVGGRTITGPTFDDGLVFATRGMRKPLVAVKLKGKAGELERRDIQWSFDQGTPDSSTPVAWGGLLFLVSDNGIARCFDAHTGHLQWTKRLEGNYKASPVAAEGRIFFLNTEGLCTVISASSRYDKLTENKLDDQTLASPAISGGSIFIRGKKTLYRIGHPH